MSEPKDFIEYVQSESPMFSDPEVQRDVMISYARECETENARLREQAEALAEVLAGELHVFASAEFQDGDEDPVFIRCFFCGTDRPGEHDPDRSCGRMDAALRAFREANRE